LGLYRVTTQRTAADSCCFDRDFVAPATVFRQTDSQMSHHSLSPRQYLILAIVSISAPLGDGCLSRGMTAMPSISLAHPGALIAAVFTPWIALGIALLIGFFASYLTALSWADLTFVRPATALGNVILALIARFWLHETISLERWAGIVLITLGVSFVAQGPSLTQHPPSADDRTPCEAQAATEVEP